MFGYLSDRFCNRLYWGSGGLIAMFVVSGFLTANFGSKQNLKYLIMLLTGGGSAFKLMLAGAFNRNGDAIRRTGNSLLWGGAVGVILVVTMHLPFNLPEPLRALSEGNARTGADFAVGIATMLAAYGLGFAFWRLGRE